MNQEEIKKIQYCIDLVIQNFGENEDLEKIYNKLDCLLIAQNERDTYKRLAESEAKEKNKYKDIVDKVKTDIETERMSHWIPGPLYLTDLMGKIKKLENGDKQ